MSNLDPENPPPLAKDLQVFPRELTPEDIERIREEGRRWSEEFQKMARDVKNLTPEDLRSVAR